jgi:subtilase family serine protease
MKANSPGHTPQCCTTKGRAFMESRVTRLLLLAAALAIASGLLNLNPDSASAASATPTLDARVRLPGTISPWVSKAQKLGPANDAQRVLITAYLSWRNPGELEQLLRDQTNPASPRYDQFLTPEEFHAAFSPSAQDVNLVQSTLRSLGFNIEYTPDSGLFVRASGTVAQVRQVFHVSQDLYSYRGKMLRAHAEEPLMPAPFKGVVTYIGGLDESRKLMRPLHVGRLQTTIRPSSPSPVSSVQQVQPPYGFAVPSPCSHYWGDTRAILEGPGPFPYGNDLPWLPCGYTPQQVREAYGANRTGRSGRGVRVAITDLYASPTLVADVNRYSANHKLPVLTKENFRELLVPNVNMIPTGDPCTSSSWLVEQTLDVTAVHSMAPDADILYVGGACDEVDMADGGVALEPIYEVIDHGLADIVSNSWLYNGEADVSPGQQFANNLEFLQADSQGMSILFATGDDGDLTMTGFAFGGPNPVASGSWPSTSPLVTAVGGTSLLLTNASGEGAEDPAADPDSIEQRAQKQEYAWATWLSSGFQSPLISSGGTLVTVQSYPSSLVWAYGSGGGPSLSQPEPFYQLGIVPEILATQTVTSTGESVLLSPPKRVTPDISMLADGFTGFLVGETYLISSAPVDAGCRVLSATTEYCEVPNGGTSLATPLFAGVLALVNEERFRNHLGPVGFVSPALYRLPVGLHGSDDAPIIKVNAPTKPIGWFAGFLGINNFVFFGGIDSNINVSGEVIENVDSSLLSRPEYDSATGLGAPNVPPLIRALSH